LCLWLGLNGWLRVGDTAQAMGTKLCRKAQVTEIMVMTIMTLKGNNDNKQCFLVQGMFSKSFVSPYRLILNNLSRTTDVHSSCSHAMA